MVTTTTEGEVGTGTRHMAYTPNVALTQICIWGEMGDLALMWSQIDLIFQTLALRRHITKVARIQQTDRRYPFDLWGEERYMERILDRISIGTDRFGWYIRPHIAYIDRVGRGAPTTPKEARTANLEPTTAIAPLLVGTLNVHGLKNKKQDVRTLLEET